VKILYGLLKKQNKMKTLKEILEEIDNKIEVPLVSARFGDGWKEHMIKEYKTRPEIDVEYIVYIAWKQGRKAILLERELTKCITKIAETEALKEQEQKAFRITGKECY